MSPHRSNILRSIGGELLAQSSRVRDLIGEKHWLSDGLHKESLLASVLERHLPGATLLTHGFLLAASRPSICSRELDLLLLDLTHEGPIFRQSGLSMALARQAMAAVSVKATCSSKTIAEVMENLGTAREVAAVDNVRDRLWCGAYFYMLDSTYLQDPTKVYSRIGTTLSENSVAPGPNGAPRGLQAVCAGPDHFFTVRYEGAFATIRGYRCEGLAPGIFAAHLLNHVALSRGAEGHGLSDLIDEAPASPLEPASFEQALN